jgi:hypothetical protein
VPVSEKKLSIRIFKLPSAMQIMSVTCLIQHNQTHFQGEPVNLNRTMNVSIVNALWLILVGEKLELDDPKTGEVIRLFDELFRKSSGAVSPLVSILPHHSMAKWPLLRTLFEYETHYNTLKATREFIEPYITEHLNTLDPENIRDFMDVMLVEIKNTTDKSAPFFGRSGNTLAVSDYNK